MITAALQADEYDALVIGSGAAGLVAALAASASGARVAVLERSPLLGGTTAVSGGMIWVPGNPYMKDLGMDDSRADALEYLRACAGDGIDQSLLEAYVDGAPEMIDFVVAASPARFCAVPRPDYRPEWPGGREGGRTLDNLPFDTTQVVDLPVRPRRSALPITHGELTQIRTASGARAFDRSVVEERQRARIATLGAALAASLVAGCQAAGVTFFTDTRAVELVRVTDRVTGAVLEGPDGSRHPAEARVGVVVACGGFEWNSQMCEAFLGQPMELPISPPWNTGDGVCMGQRAGAALSNMTEAWWVPAFAIPGERYDGEPLSRHSGTDGALPGAIMVNGRGERFVNEAVNYNDLGSAFAVRDSNTGKLRNLPAWLIFDDRCRREYQVVGVAPSTQVPDWWVTSESIADLATRLSIPASALVSTVEAFGSDARKGVDRAFHRGESAHDRFYGDSNHLPNPCLAPLERAPFYAVQIHPGAFGTKGGILVDARARALDGAGQPIPGLFAAGNASAGLMGRGYPGAGATLGAAMTFGYLAGREIASALPSDNPPS